MSIVSTSGSWKIAVHDAAGDASLDAVDFSAEAKVSGVVTGGIDQALAQFDTVTKGQPYAASLTATITLDDAEDIGFYLFAAGHARIYIDGVLAGEVTVADLPGAGEGPCPANGGAVCLCQADDTYAQDKISAMVGAGEHEIKIEYLNLDPSASMNVQWAVGDIGRRELDLSVPEARIDVDVEGDGEWGDLMDWSLVSIHTAVLDDGRVLTYGGEAGSKGNFVLNYDIWDPVTNTHTTYDIKTQTDTFCSAMIAIPGTSKVVIVGGDALPDEPFVSRGDPDKAYISWSGTSKVNIFDADTGEVTEAPGGDMAAARWYPTVVTLPTGQIVVLGGRSGNGSYNVATPEIYTYGEGWRPLEGAADPDINSGWYYPRAFALDDGNILFTGTNGKLKLLDVSGDGALTEVGTLPFTINVSMPSTIFQDGKALIMATDATLWVMDYSGDVPQFEQVATLPLLRRDANFTVMADGKVMISGGSETGRAAEAEYTTTIWDPLTNSLTDTEDEATFRIYHSTTVLLRDGTILSTGGTTDGSQFNGQVYRPDYLYDENGQPADRPEITTAPLNANAGQTVVIVVDDASDIVRLTLSKSQASTHSVQMSSGFLEPEFTVLDNNTIQFTIPDIEDGMNPGNWMLFAWNTAGTPSMAPIIRVNPVLDANADADGNLLFNGDFNAGGHDALGWAQDGDANRAAAFETDGDAVVIFEDGGTISQTIATEAGETYRLSFDLSLIGSDADIGKILVEALNGATADYSQTVEIGVDGSSALTYHIAFTASGDATTIRFSDTSDSDTAPVGISLDAVELSRNLVSNGSFEELGGIGPGGSFPHWVSDGVGGLRKFESTATDGDQYFSLGGWSDETDGALIQTIPTVIGQSYTVTFTAFGSRNDVDARITFQAGDDGAPTFSATTEVLQTRETHSFSFVATETSTVIKLLDATTGSPTRQDIAVDRVVVNSVDGANLLVNGSFQDGGIGSGVAPDGWTITGGGGRHSSATRSSESDTDGDGYYALGGWSTQNDGQISQTVQTEVGKSYTLSFSAGVNYGDLSDARLIKVDMLNGASVVKSKTFDLTDSNQMYHVSFVATSTSTTVNFADASAAGGYYDIDLDAVSLIAAVAPAIDPLLQNASFETAGADQEQAAGWTFEDGARRADPDASDEEFMIIHGGDGAIHQTIATIPNSAYTVTFDLTKHGLSDREAVLRFEAITGETVDLSETVVARGSGTVTFSFVATGINTTIRLSDAADDGATPYDLLIDDVSVKQVPTDQVVLLDVAANRFTGSDRDDIISGHDGNDVLYGAAGQDTLLGGDGNDRLYGGDGNDLLQGGAGNDLLRGADEDVLYGGAGDDVIQLVNYGAGAVGYGGDGDDNLQGGNGFQALYGEGGNDTLFGGNEYNTAERDTLDGGDGNDLIISGDDEQTVARHQHWGDLMFGGAGDDTIRGGVADDEIYGGTGRDRITGGKGADDIDAGAGHDTVYAGDGDDTVYGGDGNDAIYNGSGQDLVYAGDGNDRVYTSYNNNRPDVVYGEAGNDALFGTNGEQHLFGGEGNDTLTGGNDYGTADVDVLDGGAGDDILISGQNITPININWAARGDIMNGGAGNDTITGGDANDQIDGGDGQDVLIFSGEQGDYVVELSGLDLIFTDQRTQDGDGRDIVSNVEIYRFTDGDITRQDLITDLTDTVL